MWIISIIFLLSTKSARVKHCVNCKHFIKAIENLPTQDEDSYNILFGKCALFRRNYLVSGKGKPVKPEIDYMHCSTARSFEDMCGIDGRLHKRDLPVHEPL